MHNRLIHEKSPYLLKHAENPVDWYPWGEEAFEKARSEDRPVFLSIGYSTCHWCNVMEDESFSDPEVAALMNESFVSIKVDREERPDLDNIYMAVCQMVTGGGGWPLTVIMAPDKRPFFAGTYYPKHSGMGRIGMMQLVPRIMGFWREQRDEVIESAGHITERLVELSEAGGGCGMREDIMKSAYRALAEVFDPGHCGFGTAPRFPIPHYLMFLLRYWRRYGEAHALQMTERTLDAMRLGGIYDHLGGGFHRYSTDQYWLVPHYEKMLYDQALLALAYLEAHQATGRDAHAHTARDIFSFVLRDMTSPKGGFYSALSADTGGEEGRFYLWTEPQVRDTLAGFDSKTAEAVLCLFGIRPEGNFHHELTGEFTGDNVLHLQKPLAKAAKEHGLDDEVLKKAIQVLYEARQQREHPALDDKVLADWNGLMVAALARGYRVLGDREYLDAARRAADFVLENMHDENGLLLHRYRDGDAALHGMADDYAFLVWGLIELYEASGEARYLGETMSLMDDFITKFWRGSGGGFYFTPEDGEPLPVRRMETYDGAVPSANSVAFMDLLRLGMLTGNERYSKLADELVQALSGEVEAAPSAHAMFLAAYGLMLGPAHQVAVVGEREADDTHAMISALGRGFFPNISLVFVPADEERPDVYERVPYVKNYFMENEHATAWVCVNRSCQPPVTKVEELVKMLG